MSSGLEIGRKIKTIRLRAGLNQAQFARRIGVSQHTVSHIERGARKPSWDVLGRICRNFDVSANWLILPADGESQELAHTPDLTEPSIIALVERVAEVEAKLQISLDGRHEGLLPLSHIGQSPGPEYAGDSPRRDAKEFISRPVGCLDREAFACRLDDEAMQPDFKPTDVLVFSPAEEVRSSDYACVRIGEQHSTFRQVFFDDDIVRLVALDRTQPELRLARDQVMGMFRLVARITEF